MRGARGWLALLALGALVAGYAAWSRHERAVGAWRAETRRALALADSARARAEDWEERYHAARRDSARLAEREQALALRAREGTAETERLARRGRAEAETLAQAGSVRDSLASMARALAALDSALASSERARRADSLRAEMLRVDRDRWRTLAEGAEADLARARSSIAALTEQVHRAPVGGGTARAAAALLVGVALGLVLAH